MSERDRERWRKKEGEGVLDIFVCVDFHIDWLISHRRFFWLKCFIFGKEGYGWMDDDDVYSSAWFSQGEKCCYYIYFIFTQHQRWQTHIKSWEQSIDFYFIYRVDSGVFDD